MMFRTITIAATMIALNGAPVAAQMACGPRAAVIEQLGQKYGETRRYAGLTDSTEIFEIWASEETGSWTILKTTPNGLACFMAVGEGWESETPKQGDET